MKTCVLYKNFVLRTCFGSSFSLFGRTQQRSRRLFLVGGGDRVDFDQKAVVKRAGWDNRTRRTVLAEYSPVNLVDGVPKVDVSDVHRHFQHAAPVAAGGLKNSVDVVQRLFGLFLDRAGFVCAGSGVD